MKEVEFVNYSVTLNSNATIGSCVGNMAASYSCVFSAIPDSREWCKFFEGAGLPKSVSADYAAIFTENRIKSEHLKDLNETYLKLMKIEKVGDIIAILHHSRNVLEQFSCEKIREVEKKPGGKKLESRVIVKKKSCGPTVSSARYINRNIADEDNNDDVDDEEEIVDDEEIDEESDQDVPVPVVSKVIEKSRPLKRKLSTKDEIRRPDVPVEVIIPSSPMPSISSTAPRLSKKVRRVVPPEATVQTSAELVKTAPSKKKVFARLGEKTPSSTTSVSEAPSQPSFVITDNFGFVKMSKVVSTKKPMYSRLGHKEGLNSPDSSVNDDIESSQLNEVAYLDEVDDDDEIDYEEDIDAGENFINNEIVKRTNLQERLRYENRTLSKQLPPMSSKSALPYMGILKTSKQKTPLVKTKMTTMRADQEQQMVAKKVIAKKVIRRPLKKQLVRLTPPAPSSSQSTQGILSKNTIRVNKSNVKDRLGRTGSLSLVTKSRIQLKPKSSEPTQDKSIGSTTTIRRERRIPIVYDLKSDDEEDHNVLSKSKSYIVNRKPSSLSFSKNVTFRDPMTDYYPSTIPSPKLKDRYPRGSIAMQTGVYRRLGNSNL